MRRLFGVGLVGLWLASVSCGDSDFAVNASNTGTSGSTGTDTGVGPVGDSTAAPMSTDGDGSADGTGNECTLANVEVCDDADPCTVDDCFDGQCTHDPQPDDAPCTTRESMGGTCQGGECTVLCSTDSECDDGNTCTVDTCDPAIGQCTFEELDGVEADPSAQTEADCSVVDCENGVAVDNPDSSDEPDDGNDCTVDDCSMGDPVFQNLPTGTACGADGVCNGAGECVECISPMDCTDLPADDDCQTRTCVAGVCGQDFTAAGTPVNATLQTGGNCQQIVCDGAGDMESEDDDTDLPVDGLECTDDVCNSGLPFNPPLPSGTDCSAGLCNATGQCVGCVVPADCGGTNTFCQTVTCITSICGVNNTVGGIPLPSGQQIASDCQELQCDGNGAVQAVPNNADLPADDGSQCTGEVCSNGLQQHPDLPVDTACSQDGGIVCDGAGTCVACNEASQCGNAGQCQVDACTDHVCVPEIGPAGQACNDGLFCTVTDSCNAAGACVGAGSPCIGPDGDGNCSESCNEATDSCNADDPSGSPCDDGLFCTGGDTCNAVGTCVGGASPCAGPDGDADCMESCDEGSDSCTLPDPPGTTCDDGLFCTGGDSCGMGGVCQGGPNPCPGADGDGNCAESCNEGADLCNAPDPLGASCNDGQFCTQTDSCNAGGACIGTGNPCPGADNDANCAESCNETSDSCTANDPVGSTCDDGLFCTGTDTCNLSGTCVGAGNPCPGADGDVDCSEACNEATNDCSSPDPVGSSCNDGLFCTGADSCNAAGLCTGAGNPCPGPDGDGNCAESCDETFDTCGGNDPAGVACSDGLFCTSGDACNGSGSCLAGGSNPCAGPDGDNDCSESCDETLNNCDGNDPVGSSCSDGLFCNGTETCSGGGACLAGTAPCGGAGDGDADCSEVCREAFDDCNGNDPSGSVCSDGLFCNGSDTCNGSGSCSGHSGNPCLPLTTTNADCSESCSEAADACTANDPSGTGCSDGLFCNGTDTCNASGSCSGHSGNPCPGPDNDNDCSEMCNEGQDNCTSNDPAGSACNDGAFCNGTDTCNGAGLCSNHSGNPCPGADGDCDCSETCREDINNCTGNDPNGSTCGFGLCSSGSCIGICF